MLAHSCNLLTYGEGDERSLNTVYVGINLGNRKQKIQGRLYCIHNIRVHSFPDPSLTTDNPTSPHCSFELSNSGQMSIRLSSENPIFSVHIIPCFYILYSSICKFDNSFILLNLSNAHFCEYRTIILLSSLNCNK